MRALLAALITAALLLPAATHADDSREPSEAAAAESGAMTMTAASPTAAVALTVRAPSTSCAWANRGALAGGIRFPDRGLGYLSPEPWLSRDHRYGTAELVAAIERAAATVDLEHPGSVLGVADLSAPLGGALPGHRSHQSGRDVDLIYYAVDDAGSPVHPDGTMPYYARTGLAYYARSPSWTPRIRERYFDRARNWALVKALLTDPLIQVEQLFVSDRVERWLVEYAREIGEPADLIAIAQRTMYRPKRGESHNDHLHLRIGCSAEDRVGGRCRDGVYKPRRRGTWRVRVRCPIELEP